MQPAVLSAESLRPGDRVGVSLMVTFAEDFDLIFYRVVSGNGRVAQDPAAWVVEARDEARESWVELDRRSDVVFEARHKALTFSVKTTGFKARVFRIIFSAVRNEGFQPVVFHA